MIRIEKYQRGSCLSCGRKQNLYKLSAIDEKHNMMQWSMLLCSECLSELQEELEFIEMPREFKCQKREYDSCQTCKYEDVEIDTKEYTEICMPCTHAKCPLVDAEGSCSGCYWEEK